MMRGTTLVCVAFLLFCLAVPVEATVDYGSRPVIAFSNWPWATTGDADDNADRFARDFGEVFIVERFDIGVPWTALLGKSAWPAAFDADVTRRASRHQIADTYVVSVNSLALQGEGIAPDVDASAPPLSAADDFQRADVAQAYADYCVRMIRRFDATHFIYNIEVNEYLVKHPEQWSAFAMFVKRVRAAIRAQDEFTYIGQSVSLHGLLNMKPAAREDAVVKLRELLAGDTFVAISYYPFLLRSPAREDVAAAFDLAQRLKTDQEFMTVSETGELAQDLIVPELGLNVAGTPDHQALFVKRLMQETVRHRYAGIIWWTHQDYDDGLTFVPERFRAVARIRRDTGLLDEAGRARPAWGELAKWMKVMNTQLDPRGREYPDGFRPKGRWSH